MRSTVRALLMVGSLVVAQVAGIAGASAAEPKVDGFDVVGNVGYGTATDNYTAAEVKGDPFGFMLGVDAGYTFRFKLRLGLIYTHGFGRDSEGTRSGTGGAESPVQTHHRSDMMGGTVGYDWLLDPIRLRASLDAGVGVFIRTTDAGDLPTGIILLAAPGFAALWQLGPLELGAGLKYYLLSSGPGFSGSLMAGARFF
jgi:hypothetical protein